MKKMPPNCPWPSNIICGPYENILSADFAKGCLEAGMTCPQIELCEPVHTKIMIESFKAIDAVIEKYVPLMKVAGS